MNLNRRDATDEDRAAGLACRGCDTLLEDHEPDECNGWFHCGPTCCGPCPHCGR